MTSPFPAHTRSVDPSTGTTRLTYGATGSTTTGNVSSRVSKNVRFVGQHIWRYHPKKKTFEIYAEGGGNTFSLDFDSKGRLFSGTLPSGHVRSFEAGKNVTDEKFLQEVIPAPEFGGAFIHPGAERRVSIEVGYKF